jgi:glycosyltransferase involved in cell wall biosynthesis
MIGWTGSHSTIKYLNEIIPVLRELEKVYDFRFRVISDVNPDIDLKSFEYIAWNKKSEIKDLLPIDIGLMPLPDNEWTRGKCGLKALQYMALGSPVLLSPVGMNTELIEDGVQGYFCREPEDWRNKLELLLTDREKLKQMGAQTRSIVQDQYSIDSNRSKFLLLFA